MKQMRAMADRALQLGMITVEKLPAPDLPQELATVWEHLPADIPDARLHGHIADATGLPRSTVDTALSALRSLGESDVTLIVRGHACGVITKQDTKQDLRPLLRPRRADPRHRPAPTPKRRRSDPLGLLPAGMPEPCPNERPLGGYVVTGQGVDVVRLSLDACRTVLEQLQATPEQSGPVLGHMEGRVALFFLESGLQDGWRTPGGRLCRRGLSMKIPPAGGDSTAYWVVPYSSAYWKPEVFERLLASPRAHPGQ
ncbi:hypothetical protein ACFXP1_22570 [Streptomyces sp. NPDC059112]|uniref:hypothetical protein n=1 Tax=Streptomyces sp. NPDC059112 TaxID=3346730 RepID=UPI0036770063